MFSTQRLVTREVKQSDTWCNFEHIAEVEKLDILINLICSTGLEPEWEDVPRRLLETIREEDQLDNSVATTGIATGIALLL